MIADFYKNENNSYIERLFSEDKVAIKDCYINLSILEKDKQDKESKEEKEKISKMGYLHDARIQSFESLYNVEHSKMVAPDKLFSQQLPEDKCIHRVLILGRAGIGKSTFCKYLVNQWALAQEHGLSKEKEWSRFDLLIWIPLRELPIYLQSNPANSIASFLLRPGVLGRELKKEKFTEEEIEALLNDKEQKTLYILDGYDEIGNLGKSHSIWPMVQILKNMSNWLITSRPYYLEDMSPYIDRKLEIMGFTNENISHYIDAYFSKKISSPEKPFSKELISYLKKNKAIWGTVHIPIQLELICYIFIQKYDSEDIKQVEIEKITMTGLYYYLEFYLFNQYLVDGRGKEKYALSASQEDSMEMLKLEEMPDYLMAIRKIMGEVAFEGLRQNKLLIDYLHIKKICKKQGVKVSDVLKVGLIKCTSEKHGKFEEKDKFYFLHLTFQEYYAAVYIAEAFMQKKQEKRILSNKQSAEEFIGHYKYKPQYEIVFWFVMGLLANKNLSDCQRFFEVFEAEPRDTLELKHTILSIRLLEECISGNDGKTLKDYNRDLYSKLYNRVVSYIINICRNSYRENDVFYLAARVLIQALTLSPRLVLKEGLLNFLTAQEALVDAIHFVENLSSAGGVLPDILITSLLSLLRNEKMNDEVRSSIVSACAGQSSLSKNVRQGLIDFLQDKKVNEGVRRKVAAILTNRANLDREMIQELIAFLQNEKVDEGLRGVIASGLASRSDLDEEVIQEFIAFLYNEKMGEAIKDSVVSAFASRSNLDEKAILKFMAFFGNEEICVELRSKIAYALAKQSNLDEEVIKAIITFVQDAKVDEGTRCGVIFDLMYQSNLDEEAIKMFLFFLQDEKIDGSMKCIMAYRLASLFSLDGKAIQIFIALLKNENVDEGAKGALAYALAKRSDLDEEAIQVLIAFVQDKKVDEEMRASIAYTLARQSDLDGAGIKVFITFIEDRRVDKKVRGEVALALTRQSNDEEAIKTLIFLLQDENLSMDVRYNLASIVEGQSNLDKETIKILIALLQDKKISIGLKSKILGALARQSNLDEDAIKVLITLLKDEKVSVELKEKILFALESKLNLNEDTIQAIIALFQNKEVFMELRIRSFSVLEKRSDLDEKAIKRLIICLQNEDVDEWTMNSIISILKKQSNLNEEVINMLIHFNFFHSNLNKTISLLRKIEPQLWLDCCKKTEVGNKKIYFTRFLCIHGMTPVGKKDLGDENIEAFMEALIDFKKSNGLIIEKKEASQKLPSSVSSTAFFNASVNKIKEKEERKSSICTIS